MARFTLLVITVVVLTIAEAQAEEATGPGEIGPKIQFWEHTLRVQPKEAKLVKGPGGSRELENGPKIQLRPHTLPMQPEEATLGKGENEPEIPIQPTESISVKGANEPKISTQPTDSLSVKGASEPKIRTQSSAKWLPVNPEEYPLVQHYLKELGEEGNITIKAAWYQDDNKSLTLVDYVEGNQTCQQQFLLPPKGLIKPQRVSRHCTVKGPKWEAVPEIDYPILISYLEKIGTKGEIVIQPSAYYKQIANGGEYKVNYTDGIERCTALFSVSESTDVMLHKKSCTA